MNSDKPKDELLEELIATMRDDELTEEQQATLEQMIANDAAARWRFVEHMHLEAALQQECGTLVESPSMELTEVAPQPVAPQPRKRWAIYSGVVATAAAAVLAFTFWFGFGSAKSNVRFEALAHAEFFAELSPALDSNADLDRKYVLNNGMVRLAFPTGASATVEAPAVFRVLSDQSIALDVGQCSVHAPDGAEGFRVETPQTTVIDLGTRFAVSVNEVSDTEVHVIEGAAEVRDRVDKAKKDSKPKLKVQLKAKEASKITRNGSLKAKPVEFKPETFRDRLPDRIVSYAATVDAKGSTESLRSVTVQRGGTVKEIPFDKLILADLTWFKSGKTTGNLITAGSLPADVASMLSDSLLHTGVNNPGGAVSPLTSNPVMTDAATGTPGFAMKFRAPVMNGPGPDVVFFEIQTDGQPPVGDFFHISPLRFESGQRSHTIREYDLTMTSPEALSITRLNVFQYANSVESLSQLRSSENRQMLSGTHGPYQVLAVGIDLSDLGYREGESVDGLFFQDALDDSTLVDPVFIAGLPE